MKARPPNVGGRKRMMTFTPIDAKLRRLLYWYHKHIADVSVDNISSLKHSEKQERINVLIEAETTWRAKQKMQRHTKQQQQQQQITKFFKIKQKSQHHHMQ